MAFHYGLKLEDLPQGHMSRVDIGQDEILVANVEGGIYAVSDRCGHMNASLSKGRLDGKIVECPLHKVRYDVTNGKIVSKPKIPGFEEVLIGTTNIGKIAGSIKALDVRTYKTRVEGDVIEIEIPKE